MDEKMKEAFKQRMDRVEQSKRRDCSEYGDCFHDATINGCESDCTAYSKSSNEAIEDLRECDCKGEDDSKLEMAHVSYVHWVVKCHACGVLGMRGRDKSEAVEKWNANEIARPREHFWSN